MRFCRLAKALGVRVTKIRNDFKMTVPEFAAHCGIDCTLMYDIEKGEHDMFLYTFMRICKCCNQSYDEHLKPLEHLCAECEDSKRQK